MSVSSKRGGKPDFTYTGQLYIELTESTANVAQVCEAVRRQWGTEYTVVSTEGLEIDDSLATQGQSHAAACHISYITTHAGISFWKSPRCKLYAVTCSDIQECRSKTSRSSFIEIDSSDDDMADLSVRKKKKDDDRLKGLADDMASVKEMLTDLMSVTANSTLPIGWKRLLRDTFKC